MNIHTIDAYMNNNIFMILYLTSDWSNQNVYHIENYKQVGKRKLLKLFPITTVETCCVNLIEENIHLRWIELIILHEQIKSWTLKIRNWWILNCSWTVNKIIESYSRQSCGHTRVSVCCHSTEHVLLTYKSVRLLSLNSTVLLTHKSVRLLSLNSTVLRTYKVSGFCHSTAQSCWHTRVSGCCHSMIQV